MADPFLAEIRIFPFDFAPTGWAFCDGQLMPISQNTALFALLGTTYGGDGKSTYALPDLIGRAPMHPADDPSLPLHTLGEVGGSETVTLLESEIPHHTHTVGVDAANPADVNVPGPSTVLAQSSDGSLYRDTADTTMGFQALGLAGGSLPHNNMQPYLTANFCIALQGVFPPRH